MSDKTAQHYDVYLAGVSSQKWRKIFKKSIDKDIIVFDPYVKNFNHDDDYNKSEQIAREFYFMDNSELIVFYFNKSKSNKSVRIQLGDAIGSKKQVIVCLDGTVDGNTYVERYCEYRGVITVKSIDELITATEEYLAQVELCYIDEEM